MMIYHYTQTGSFSHTSEARLDPVEGLPLVPAFSTTVAPPEVGAHEVAIWSGDGWAVMADFRGEEYWLADGSHHVIDALDEHPPAEALDAPPPPDPEELAAARLATAKAECRTRIYASASAETQMNMATAAAVASAVPEPDRSPDQVYLLAGVASALNWVAAMRATVATLASDPDADITDDAAWPDLPAEAAAVAAMF